MNFLLEGSLPPFGKGLQRATRRKPPLVISRGGSQIISGSGLSNLEFRLAAKQARERPGLAWSMCQLEQAVAFCLEQKGLLFGFEFGQSQFHLHFAPLSRLERAPLIGLARS